MEDVGLFCRGYRALSAHLQRRSGGVERARALGCPQAIILAPGTHLPGARPQNLRRPRSAVLLLLPAVDALLLGPAQSRLQPRLVLVRLVGLFHGVCRAILQVIQDSFGAPAAAACVSKARKALRRKRSALS